MGIQCYTQPTVGMPDQHKRPNLATGRQQGLQVVHRVLRVAGCGTRLTPAQPRPIIATHARELGNLGTACDTRHDERGDHRAKQEQEGEAGQGGR